MRIVVKVGTSTLAHSTGRLNIRRVGWARVEVPTLTTILICFPSLSYESGIYCTTGEEKREAPG